MSLNTILATAPLATTGFHIKATGTTLGNSLIWDNGTNVGIGNTNTSYTLDVSGTGRFTSTLNIGNATANSSLKFLTGGSTTYSGSITLDSNADILNIGGGNTNTYNDGASIGLMGADRYGTKTGGTLSLSAGNAVNNTTYGYIALNTGNTERMRITYAGNVGIGTSSPNSILEIKESGTTNSIRLGSPASASTYSMVSLNGTNVEGQYIGFAAGGGVDTSLYYQSGNAGNHIFRTGNGSAFTERMRITSAGNVGIGTTNPQMPLSVQANTGNGAIRLIGTSNASSNNAGIYWYDSNDSTFNGYLGNFSGSFDIYNHRSTPMVFSTAGTERMRITSGGKGLFGTTTPSAGASGFGTTSFQVNNEVVSLGSTAGIFWENRSGGVTTSSNWYGFYTTSAQIYLYNGSANLASVNMSSGAWQGLSPSDRRLKDNIQEYDKGLKDILKLNVKQWEYNGKAKTVKGDKGVGLIADELEKVIPEFVLDYENYLEDGDAEKTTLKRVDLSELNFILVKAIQEMNTKLDAQNQTIQNLQEQINILAK